MDKFELAIIRRALETDEERTIFKLMCEAERRGDDATMALYSLCLSCLLNPLVKITVLASLESITESMASALADQLDDKRYFDRN